MTVPTVRQALRLAGTGCAPDNDSDGIGEVEALCSGTSDGDIDRNGCEADEDADGVADRLDQCPDTPVPAVPGLAAGKQNEASTNYHLVKMGENLIFTFNSLWP